MKRRRKGHLPDSSFIRLISLSFLVFRYRFAGDRGKRLKKAVFLLAFFRKCRFVVIDGVKKSEKKIKKGVDGIEKQG